MSSELAFLNDIYESYTRKCLVLPSDGSEPQLVEMTIRTATQDDITNFKLYSRTLDLLVSYGSEYRKTRVWSVSEVSPGKHLLYFNMSPKLPLNRCVARIVDANPDDLKSKLFWRGDVVMMRYESQDDIYINCQDVDISSTGALEEVLRDAYMTGRLEEILNRDEEWALYCSKNFNWTSRLHAMLTGYHPYWGKDWRREEAIFLDDIQELREHTGRGPISRHSGSFGLLGTTFMSVLKASSTYFLSSRPPLGLSLPPELERRIFEMSARSNWKTCSTLVLVARRVCYWIEPILYETIIFDHSLSFTASELKFKSFMANLDSKSPEFYARHVKNLWILAGDDPNAFERILTMCSGVENLVLFPIRQGINHPFIPFLEHATSGSHLRRLTCRLEHLFLPWSNDQNFQHACFANLTHLHLYDEAEEWSNYMGFENLRSLTHLALACCGPQELAIVTPKLPALEYVALCHYKSGEFYIPRIVNRFPIEVYGIRVVCVDGLTTDDWERGTAGRGDFWDLVEREVTRRRANRVNG